jgi:hypothetical protein
MTSGPWEHVFVTNNFATTNFRAYTSKISLFLFKTVWKIFQTFCILFIMMES